MIVRLATLADIPSIKAIADIYRTEIGFVRRGSLIENMERGSLYVVEVDDQVAGFANGRQCNDGWYSLYEIAISRDHTDLGYGRTLLAALPTPLRLKCPVDNAANGFYAACGLTHVGTEPGKIRELNVWEWQ